MRTLLMLALAASTAAAQSDEPLEAHLLRPTRWDLVLDVSEKAYVAIFSLPWDGGTPTLVYPGYPNPSREPAGEHVVRYQGALVNSWVDYVTSGHTTTLVLIASRTPLKLDSYGRHHTTLVQALGGYTLASSKDADLMTDRLIHLVAAQGATVTVDSYIFRY